MSNQNSQRANLNTSNAVLTSGSTASSTQIAIAPAVIVAGAIAREALKKAAQLAITYGRKYIPTAVTGFTAGAGAGFAGLDPSDRTTVDLAKAAAWQLYQRANPTAAAQPAAQTVFNLSFTAGIHAGQLLRTTVANNNVPARDTALALKTTNAGKAGSDGFVIGTASVNTNASTQKQVPSVRVA
jgi:hypothetical protein